MNAFLKLLRFSLKLLIPASIILTIYLYTFPLIHKCGYPNEFAPFRLLTLADPQLEGDTSIYSRRYQKSHPIIRELRRIRKTIDIWGNDYYLAHIYRSLYTFSNYLVAGGRPTHTVVLGDLVGSQWIGDEEFTRRGRRYWDRVFSGAQKVPIRRISDEKWEDDGLFGTTYWIEKLINVAGNHDVGYAGDITPHLLARFEHMYGPSNYMFTHTAPNTSHTLRIVVLNSLHIDGPTKEPSLQADTYAFLNKVLANESSKDTATILLTHVPLHKESGICIDAPMIRYYEGVWDREGTIREQNHISQPQSNMLLDHLFPSADSNKQHKGIILTGHDHEGCDIWHYKDDTTGEWKAARYTERDRLHVPMNSAPNERPGIREVTVRSMMGEFGGNAGFLSAWWDDKDNSWQFAYSTCPLGIQHFWWTVHVVDFITLVFGVAYMLGNSRAKAIRKKNVPKVVITMVDDENVPKQVQKKKM